MTPIVAPPPSPLNTAVLFLVFNRPDTTAQVFEAIRQARPPRLYVAADGARAGRDGEAERVAKVRDIATAVDWSCDVKTLFREQNLGCKLAVSSAITWFFEQEEQGIILEDDCLPHPDFFRFCDVLLERYAEDERVSVITGDNFQRGRRRGDASYYFSKYNHVWGWASWRRAWRLYDGNLSFWLEWKTSADWRERTPDAVERRYWEVIFDRMARGEIDTWDYPWTASVWYRGGLTATPNVNLVTNIGFGEDATHTRGALRRHVLPRQALGTIAHPTNVARDGQADDFVFRHHFTSRLSRASRSVRSVFAAIRGGKGSPCHASEVNLTWCAEDLATYLARFSYGHGLDIQALWAEMDRVWRALGLDNRKPLAEQRIDDFYAHPVWVLNGLFSESDPESLAHRQAIADYLGDTWAERPDLRIADFGGGSGTLARQIADRIPGGVRIEIIEPFPAEFFQRRLAGHEEIVFRESFSPDGYDVVIAQDVLEHVEKPIELALRCIAATRVGGMVLFANCFHPFIACHLPSTFYLRHTFRYVIDSLALVYVGCVPGASHVQIFRKVGEVDRSGVNRRARIARALGPLLNLAGRLLALLKSWVRKAGTQP
ncbi:hypothetical protein SAMN05421644_1496 [Allochromatium warmingii]|uniref:Methyltransferase domain-containing protein n=1 Tax=Allochromatium warmingii TaxID=61595 RepID=A0A1H3IY61_ALLWA|nr:methyltransferase domain-containing protein [Allochromatium warmingii]SDY32118.1 hypothetical protein SAMN05421644_1496 [Allochromatium warmingii]